MRIHKTKTGINNRITRYKGGQIGRRGGGIRRNLAALFNYKTVKEMTAMRSFIHGVNLTLNESIRARDLIN